MRKLDTKSIDTESILNNRLETYFIFNNELYFAHQIGNRILYLQIFLLSKYCLLDNSQNLIFNMSNMQFVNIHIQIQIRSLIACQQNDKVCINYTTQFVL